MRQPLLYPIYYLLSFIVLVLVPPQTNQGYENQLDAAEQESAYELLTLQQQLGVQPHAPSPRLHRQRIVRLNPHWKKSPDKPHH